MKKLAIIGTKEFSFQIRDFAERSGGFEFVGYIDDLAQEGTHIDGFPVLGKVCDAERLYREGVIECVFIAVGYSRFDLREDFYNQIKGKVPLANIIHPTAIINESVRLGEGLLITEYNVIGKNCIIEDNVVILGGCLIGHDDYIGKHSYFAGHNVVAGFVRIGERCFGGINSIFSDNTEIPNDCWISLGGIVSESLKKEGKYVSAGSRLIRIP